MILDKQKTDNAIWDIWHKNRCSNIVPLKEITQLLSDLRIGRFDIEKNVFCVGIPGDLQISMYLREDTMPIIKSLLHIIEEHAPKDERYKGEIPPAIILRETDLLLLDEVRS